jgi:hypothetical protein
LKRLTWFFPAALAAFALFFAFAAAAADPATCGAPQISSRVNFHGEKIKYDRKIAFAVIGKSRERVRGKYETERKVGLTMDFKGDCLSRLDVLVDVFPTIHLMADYHDKKYRCARQSVLDHERQHGRIARKIYQKLPGKIDELAREMFSRPGEDGHAAILDELEHELNDDGPLITKFLEDLEKKQDAFDAKELADDTVIYVKCRRAKRKKMK